MLTDSADALFEMRYRAIASRDSRFDGQFFTGVLTTGIYCRPSCPARSPQPQNVRFYLTSAAAQHDGFRACKRCLPEASPGSPEWNIRQDLSGRAMRLINDGHVDRGGVKGLSARLGYSERQLNRVLKSELGAGPLALARARRAQAGRHLLTQTDLPIADVAFASGFGSIRQFNQTIREVFDLQPNEIRSRAKLPTKPAEFGPMAQLELTLPVRHPFDAWGTFQFLAVRAIPEVETADLENPNSLQYARTLQLPHGPGAIEVRAKRTKDQHWTLNLHVELTAVEDLTTAVFRTRRLFDLDADCIAVDEYLAEDPLMSELTRTVPGIRVPGTVDPHELAIRAIVGQQISVSAARAHLSRLSQLLGDKYESAFKGLSRLFPTSEQIAKGIPLPIGGQPLAPERPLRLPARSIITVASTATALADGTLELDLGLDRYQLRQDLIARPGIGPWTAAYICMRTLGDPNAWLPGDVALVAGARALGLLNNELPTVKAHPVLEEQANTWAPWRSYAAMHLWRLANKN